MNPDEFELRLKRLPSRQVPPEWREEILSAARQEPAIRTTHHAHPSPSLLSTLKHQLSTILWPHPTAWAGLAAFWLVILGVQLAIRPATPLVAKGTSPASPQVFMAYQEQERLLVELLGPREAPVAEPPKVAPPRPRSERRHALLMA